MSPTPRNKPPKGSKAQFFFFFFFFFLCAEKLLIICTLYTYVHFSSRVRAICGSAGQPLPAPDGRALCQPKPHLSGRTV